MAKIKFSKQGMTAHLRTTVFEATTGFGSSMTDGNLAGIQTNSQAAVNRLVIFKGTMPTDVQMKDTASFLTDFLYSRNTDCLLILSAKDRFLSALNCEFTFKDFDYHIARMSGTATWFAMMAKYAGVQNCLIIGDISDSNGTGMLRLSNTGIVTGTRYNVKGFKVVMPHEYDY